jgi:transposase
MLTLPAGIRVYVACGVTDMRRGFDSLSAQVQTALALDPFLCVGRGYVAARSQRAISVVLLAFAAT